MKGDAVTMPGRPTNSIHSAVNWYIMAVVSCDTAQLRGRGAPYKQLKPVYGDQSTNQIDTGNFDVQRLQDLYASQQRVVTLYSSQLNNGSAPGRCRGRILHERRCVARGALE